MGSMKGLEEPGLCDPSASSSSDNAYFDASRYEFFGKGAVEEVVLGGLEDENEAAIDSRFGGPNDAEYRFPSLGNKDEVDMLSSLADVDDLASTFAKLNRTVSGNRNAGIIGDRRSVSMESSSTTDWTAETELHNWIDPQLLDGDSLQDNKRWWSQPDPSSRDSKSLHRTSSYPLQPLTHHQSAEPVPIPKTRSSSSYPYPNQLTRHSSIPSPNSGPHFPSSGSSPYAGSQLLLTGYPHGLPFAPNIPYSPSNMYHPNLRDPMQSLLFSQKQMLNQLHMQAPVYPPHLASIMPELREQRLRPSPRGKHHHHNRHPNSSQNSETNSQRSDSMTRLQFRSRYMSAEEIESILKMQHAGTHNNDPYTDDYYHQACIAKRSSGSYNRQRFCPVSIKDSSSSKSRSSNSESHGHLQVDSLGRVSFSSIRRPRPLLEPDQPDSGSHGQKFPKPLEKEVPLAARITIEDGFSLVLEVDDIDRLLQSNPPQDGGFQLRRRRQVLLEGLAASLELVDPLSPAKPGNPAGLSPKDDLVFLRLVSLPKGRKLLSRYLQQLIPGSELARLVCMAICRHLRFLFGGLPSDTAAAETITKLAKTVSLAVRHMELSSLSACLAAVVCSSEQPPLRPIGSSAGDGASVIIKSVLERATDLLTNPHTSSICTIQNRAFWQASFDAFFKLLTKYCLGKYESILQMLLLHGSGTAVIGSDMARAISMEMPAELLCASLPHTNEQQREMLLDFAQRAMPVTGFRPDGPGSGHATSESVPG